MRLVTQILLLQQKDFKLLFRRKWLFLLEIAVALVCLPLTIFMIMKDTQIENDLGTGENFSVNYIRRNPSPGGHNYPIIVSGVEEFERNLLSSAAERMGIYLAWENKTTPSPRRVKVNKINIASKQLDYVIESDQVRSIGWKNNEPYTPGFKEFHLDYNETSAIQLSFETVFLAAVLNPNDVNEREKLDRIQNFFNDGLSCSEFPRHESKQRISTLIFPYHFIVLFLITLIPMPFLVRDVLQEKEADIKTYMMSMGLSPTSYYFSHFISGSWKITAICMVVMFPVVLGLKHVFLPFLIIVFLYAQLSVAVVLLVATIFRKALVANIVLEVIFFVLIVVTLMYPAPKLNLGLSFLYTLNPMNALHTGLVDLVLYERLDVPLKLFWLFPSIYTWECALVMLIVEIFILVVLTIFIDNVSGADGSLFSFISRTIMSVFKSRNNDEARNGRNRMSARNIEPETGMNHNNIAIEIDNLVKEWSPGQVAVNGISMNAYNGNVTVLLGHNGAGKTSTFACLTGFTRPTSGRIMICGESMTENPHHCQSMIGYCPQNNPLFNDLTVYEHMVLYGRLRTADFHVKDRDEIFNLLRKVDLLAHKDKLAKELSGGMKRKLFVALALVGKAPVVLLDEPTAGMDPSARQLIRDMLLIEKRERAILLTTHYMDEADMLGDRVAIMVKGDIVCNGAVDYLKQKYGTGYVLTVGLKRLDIAHNPQESIMEVITNILEHIKKFVPSATVQDESANAQGLNILLPYESRQVFVPMFKELEENQSMLLIESFGLSINTLEQVFIRVGEIAEGEDDTERLEHVKRVAQQLCDTTDNQETRSILHVSQMIHLLWRNALYLWRNMSRVIIPIMIALLLYVPFLLVHFKVISIENFSTGSSESVDLSFSHLPDAAITFDQDLANITTVKDITDYLRRFSQLSLLEDQTEKNFKQMYFHQPPLGFGFKLRDSRSTVPTNIFYNQRLNYGPLYAISALTNSFFRNKGGEIKMGIFKEKNNDTKVQMKSPSQEFDMEIMAKSFFGAAYFHYSLSLALACIILSLTLEMGTNFKHQLFLTKMSGLIYWSAQFLFDFCYFVLFAVLIFLLSFWSMGIPAQCIASLWPIWIIFFLSGTAITYCFSFYFKSRTIALIAMYCWHTILPTILSTIIGIISLITQSKGVQLLNRALGFVFPGLIHSSSINKLLNNCQNKTLGFDIFELYGFGENGVGFDVLEMLLTFIVFTVFLSALQSTRIASRLHTLLSRKYQTKLVSLPREDEDVIQERQWMATQSDQSLSLAVRGLYRFYNPRLCAVRNLTFGVRPDDCFGLLGVNGAGKTSTFDILTAYSYPTAGQATVNGIDVTERPPIGYCPQFDALSTDLTGWETLYLVGALNGLNDAEWRVDKVLESIQLSEERNKLVKHYSGGQKRRISIGVALMSCSRLIMLDEPTAGVDPRTRRHIWNLLTELRRNNTALLLTTHSMEECEVLCSRIGFMNKGSLITIGSTQHLKNKYGNSFLLCISLKNPSAEAGQQLNYAVCSTFGVAPTLDAEHMPTLSWQIPRKRNEEDAWSNLYQRVDDFVQKYVTANDENAEIRDYWIVQSSLQQVFIYLSHLNPAESNSA
ncbi:ABC transporter domain-containing protein [Ditylenchus destructor]|uniref:ABC transporter domain-containing protein n=1 Tax=Ditylenchus destructor TaxID=166010 RepID=A0AAD4R4J6_9BILA|nr:ABC transporter domain-containing protein [Ditylenchus destructor]